MFTIDGLAWFTATTIGDCRRDEPNAGGAERVGNTPKTVSQTENNQMLLSWCRNGSVRMDGTFRQGVELMDKIVVQTADQKRGTCAEPVGGQEH